METFKRGEWMSLQETMGKLELILAGISKDLCKVNRGNRAAAQRVRVGTLRLEKVGKLFRKESVAAEKSGKLRKKKTKKRKR
jgi:hypothetical protein